MKIVLPMTSGKLVPTFLAKIKHGPGNMDVVTHALPYMHREPTNIRRGFYTYARDYTRNLFRVLPVSTDFNSPDWRFEASTHNCTQHLVPGQYYLKSDHRYDTIKI